MYPEARRLLAQAQQLSTNPRRFMANWLAQDLTPHNVAICVLALYNLTGQVWYHPDTPNPNVLQKAKCPDVWRSGCRMALIHDPNLDKVTVGDTQSISTKFVGLRLPQGRVDEGPVNHLSIDPTKQMQVRKTPEEIARERAAGPGSRRLRWVPPKKRKSREM